MQEEERRQMITRGRSRDGVKKRDTESELNILTEEYTGICRVSCSPCERICLGWTGYMGVHLDRFSSDLTSRIVWD